MTDTTILTPSANGWGYRPHLDGLRSIAVYLVVLFHAGIPDFVGGFIGVDLFFVLSGFLVTNVILSDLGEHGTLRLRRFYARRARRLIPAASLAVVGTSVAALLVATPFDRDSLVDDARAASLWFANWHFIGESNDYFNADDAESPFLHFWSLAIEEQFYVLFPLLLLVVWRVGRRRFDVVVATFAVLLPIAIVVQLLWARNDVNRAYLGTDARAYQLLAGVLLAMLLWRVVIPTWLRTPGRVAFPVATLGLVVAGTSVLDVDASTRGLIAAGCSVVMIGSAEAGRGGWFGRVLGLQPIRYLGSISYGTYLWHWPVVVLTHRVLDTSPWAAFVLSAVLGTALAALSYQLLEYPIRREKRLDRFPAAVIAAGVAMALVSGLIVAPALLTSDRRPAVVARSGGSGVTPVPDIDWDSIDLEPPQVPECVGRDGTDCVIVDADGATMLLIGDSHMRMYIPAFEQLAEARGLRLAVAFAQACPWQRSAYSGKLEQKATVRCIEMRERTFDSLIPALDPEIIVAAGRANTIGRLGRLGSTREDLASLDPSELYTEMANDTIAEWVRDGRDVVLIEPIVEFARPDQDPVSCLSGAQYVEQCVFPALHSEVEERVLRAAARTSPNVAALDLDDLKCPGLVLCPPIIDDVVVNRDQSHLSHAFVVTIASIIEDRLVDSGALPPR